MTSKRSRTDVDATSLRRIDVNTTSFRVSFGKWAALLTNADQHVHNTVYVLLSNTENPDQQSEFAFFIFVIYKLRSKLIGLLRIRCTFIGISRSHLKENVFISSILS